MCTIYVGDIFGGFDTSDYFYKLLELLNFRHIIFKFLVEFLYEIFRPLFS